MSSPAEADAARVQAAQTRTLGALAGAVDDLHRAALILRQIASGTSSRIGRTPEDYRRIASQFSERAQACQAARDEYAVGVAGDNPIAVRP